MGRKTKWICRITIPLCVLCYVFLFESFHLKLGGEERKQAILDGLGLGQRAALFGKSNKAFPEEAAEQERRALIAGGDADKPAYFVEGPVEGAAGGSQATIARGTMDCSAVKKGPNPESIPNIAFWKEIPADDVRVSEYASIGPTDKYVTFEPDCGGWNNIRMGFESVVTFAVMTGRTLVMPPKYVMYLLNNDPDAEDNKNSFDMYYNMDVLKKFIKIMPLQEFLDKEVYSGNLGKAPDGNLLEQKQNLWNWLETASLTNATWPAWEPGQFGLVFPKTPGEAVNVEEPGTKERLHKWLSADRRQMATYTMEQARTKVIHFSGHCHEGGKARMLTHFYTFQMHEDEARDLYMKRFVRDHLHYREEMFCKASQIIALLKRDGGGFYSSFHVRRGDLQFTEVKIPAQEIFDNTWEYLTERETLYISTDEKDRAFFEPFYKRYKVKFLSDYYDQVGLDEVNQNYIGMIEQIVASHGRTFTGTYLSTFTAFIFRMRMWLDQPMSANYYFFAPKKTVLQDPNIAPHGPWFAREFPICCLDIDKDVPGYVKSRR